MGLRILVVHPLTKEDIRAADDITGGWGDRHMGGYEESIQKFAKKVSKPDTEVVQWFIEKYAGSLQNLYLGMVTTMPIVNRIIRAEQEGFDAVVLGCHGDNGVQIARSVAHIPVVGPCEASMV